MPISIVDYAVELPSGGVIHLQTPDEVQLWEKALERYRSDYIFAKHNDLVTLGLLLQSQITLYRCQVALNGMEPEVDSNNLPTGSYRRIELDAGDVNAFQRAMSEASKEMRAHEKSLGIDKATRESGGAHTVDNYIKLLKRAAHDRGIHIAKRTLAYEKFVKELAWRVRLLAHADAEDRAYHNITAQTVLRWTYEQLRALEEIDKKYARERGKLYVGQL